MALPAGAAGALLEELIDDAGLFPPARLPMAEAVAAHRRTRSAPHAGLVRTFICPASRLDELAAALGDDAHGFRLSLLVDEGDSETAVEAAIDHALSHPFEMELVETRYTPGDVQAATVHAHAANAAIFFEVPVAGATAASVAKAIDEIADAGGGVKFRCGGLSEAAFPTPAELADGLVTARAAEVMIKCTAGLHHPFRHVDDADGYLHHGFLNVAVAACLGHAFGLDAATVAPILSSEDPQAFRVTAEEVAWAELAVDEGAVRDARLQSFVGYGSCSVDEPVEDLRALGILGRCDR